MGGARTRRDDRLLPAGTTGRGDAIARSLGRSYVPNRAKFVI